MHHRAKASCAFAGVPRECTVFDFASGHADAEGLLTRRQRHAIAVVDRAARSRQVDLVGLLRLRLGTPFLCIQDLQFECAVSHGKSAEHEAQKQN